MALKSAVNCDLILTLPKTRLTQVQTLNITKFTAEGIAVKYNFVDTNRMNEKYAVDGTAEGMKNPIGTKFIEFTVTPYSDADNLMKKYVFSDTSEAMVVFFKDYNSGISISSDNGHIKEAPDSDIASNPDYRTYRIVLLDDIIAEV